jgi:hypothetical protein
MKRVFVSGSQNFTSGIPFRIPIPKIKLLDVTGI